MLSFSINNCKHTWRQTEFLAAVAKVLVEATKYYGQVTGPNKGK
jgi:hypothetical protein